MMLFNLLQIGRGGGGEGGGGGRTCRWVGELLPSFEMDSFTRCIPIEFGSLFELRYLDLDKNSLC